MLKINIVPLPYDDLTPIMPPNDLTMFSDMTKPSPIPEVFICYVLLRHPKSLNNLNLSDFLMPAPVS